MRNALSEDFPVSSVVRAKTVNSPAKDALEMKRFRPLIFQPRPDRFATVFTAFASEPTSGSLRAKAAMISPLARRRM